MLAWELVSRRNIFLRQLVTTSAPNSYRTAEDGNVVAPAGAVLANDTDVDGDALVTVLAALAEHGTVALGRDGSFTYTPATNWSGTDGFDYVVEDGNGSAERARVTVVVDPVNDAPVNVLPASLSMPRGTTATFSTAKGTGIAVGDVDLSSGKLKMTVSASNGTFTLRSRNGLYFVRGDGVGPARPHPAGQRSAHEAVPAAREKHSEEDVLQDHEDHRGAEQLYQQVHGYRSRAGQAGTSASYPAVRRCTVRGLLQSRWG